jgi:hypothetical protein
MPHCPTAAVVIGVVISVELDGAVPENEALLNVDSPRAVPVAHPASPDCLGRLARTVIPGYTLNMKTAISVPDETFDRATRQAAELGISRSEFFTRAAGRYLDELAAQSLTHQIDQALQAAADDDSAAAAARAGRRVLAAEEDW